jgi:hypothetical protein
LNGSLALAKVANIATSIKTVAVVFTNLLVLLLTVLPVGVVKIIRPRLTPLAELGSPHTFIRIRNGILPVKNVFEHITNLTIGLQIMLAVIRIRTLTLSSKAI